MRTYVLRRLIQIVPLLLGISALTFLLIKLAGDFTLPLDNTVTPETIAAMRHRFGLDRPLWVQYLLYLKNVFFHFDLGISFSRSQPVAGVLREGLLNTLL